MDQAKLEKYKQILLNEREQFSNQSNLLEHGADDHGGLDQSFTDSVGELSAYDNHPADSGDIMFERSKDIALRDNNNTFLSMIDDALDKIEKGVYGNCDHCGKEIPEERLEAFPYTTMCRDCKEIAEDWSAPRNRPLEEEALSTPFHRTFTDGTENVAFDGEDAWQKVARYGTSNSPSDVPSAMNAEDTFYDADEEQGIVAWGDAVIDDGITEEFDEDENTGNVTRSTREEYIRKD